MSFDARPFWVMSFHVSGAFREAERINAWKYRAALNVATIERYAPALIGFQELQSGNLETYQERLPGYGYVLGPRAGNGAPYEFNAIFFDQARLELLDSGGFWLSLTPQKRSSSWQARVVRSASWARLGCRETGSSFLHLNTHLDHLSRRARLEGSRLILEKIAEIRGEDLPALITGDFNCPPGSPPYRAFIEAGFEDTYLAAGNDDAGDSSTYHAFGGWRYTALRCACGLRLVRGPRRLDWILLRDPRKRIGTKFHLIARDRDAKLGIYPSDHYPVLTELAPVS